VAGHPRTRDSVRTTAAVVARGLYLLVKHGCTPQILALLLRLLRWALASRPDSLYAVIGSPEVRETEARSLEQAAVTLEALEALDCQSQ
jgi:hypothetical protein